MLRSPWFWTHVEYIFCKHAMWWWWWWILHHKGDEIEVVYEGCTWSVCFKQCCFPRGTRRWSVVESSFMTQRFAIRPITCLLMRAERNNWMRTGPTEHPTAFVRCYPAEHTRCFAMSICKSKWVSPRHGVLIPVNEVQFTQMDARWSHKIWIFNVHAWEIWLHFLLIGLSSNSHVGAKILKAKLHRQFSICTTPNDLHWSEFTPNLCSLGICTSNLKTISFASHSRISYHQERLINTLSNQNQSNLIKMVSCFLEALRNSFCVKEWLKRSSTAKTNFNTCFWK